MGGLVFMFYIVASNECPRTGTSTGTKYSFSEQSVPTPQFMETMLFVCFVFFIHLRMYPKTLANDQGWQSKSPIKDTQSQAKGRIIPSTIPLYHTFIPPTCSVCLSSHPVLARVSPVALVPVSAEF